MRKSNIGVLSSLLLKRSNATEFIAITFVTAFAISLIVSSLTLIKGFKPFVGIYISLTFLAVVVFYFVIKVYKSLTTYETMTGFIIRDKKENTILKVPRYRFSSEIVKHLDAAFAESLDMKAIWEREPLKNDTVGDLVQWENNRSRQLIHEAIEYFIIEELSFHLSEYFNKTNFEKEYIQEIGREQVPEVLIENRFLQLFSKSTDERAAFEMKKDVEKDSEQKEYVINGKKVIVKVGETVAAFAVNGAVYRRFDLVLPLGTKVKRLGRHHISIETDRFSLGIKTVVDDEMDLPEGFEDYYLKLQGPASMRYAAFEVKLEITVRFKVKNFFLKNKWEYFHWLDSFFERLNSNFSKDSFFEKINWYSAFTILQYLHQEKSQIGYNNSNSSQILQEKQEKVGEEKHVG